MRGTYAEVYQAPYTRTSILVGIFYACNLYVLYGLFNLIPDMMTYGWCGLSDFFTVTYYDQRGCLVYTKAEYLFFLATCLLNIPGVVLGGELADYFGRLKSIRVMVWLGVLSMAAFFWCISGVVSIIELIIAIIITRASFHILFLYIPECYPTYIRGTAYGCANGIGSMGSALGSLMIMYLDTISILYTFYTIVSVLLLNAIASLFLNKEETYDSVLVDNRSGNNPLTGPTVRNYGSLGANGEQDVEGTRANLSKNIKD